MFRLIYAGAIIALGVVLAALVSKVVSASDAYETWPVLTNPFESTGGGGVMIDRYQPVVAGDKCRTDFTVIIPGPQGGTFLNEVEFTAVPVAGGMLCTEGRWRAKDGSAEGTTPFRVFIKDGIVRRPPD